MKQLIIAAFLCMMLADLTTATEAASSISITQPTDRAIFQRDKDGSSGTSPRFLNQF